MAKKKSSATAPSKRRTQVSQKDVPGYGLDEALRVATAIADNYANGPPSPLQVAQALGIQPTTGPFRMLIGASSAYGLTKGSYTKNSRISIEPLGLRIVRAQIDGDDVAAKREAALKPRVLNEFLTKYDGSPLPKDNIAINVLEGMKVPRERAEAALKLIMATADKVGFLKKIKNRAYVELSGVQQASPSLVDDGDEDEDQVENLDVEFAEQEVPTAPTDLSGKKKKVFISHGKDKSFIEPIKKLLKFGELEAVVSVDAHTVSKPVPEKVMEDMRSAGAAIIHVADELKLIDKETKEHIVLNQNVLIEIGAAMALYGRRFILLVKDGITLPSNLQGLFEVRYQGDTLDGDATVRLLEAINDIKNHKLPGE